MDRSPLAAYDKEAASFFSPPPCGEGLGVGVSKYGFRCGTTTPDPSPQGGGVSAYASPNSA